MTKQFITPEQVLAASNQPVPYGALGDVVDTRTYLRYLPDAKRRETPYERNARVTNYNVGLAADRCEYPDLLAEAQLMFAKFNSLKAWASGRVAWIGGTKATDTVPESTMNCSYTPVNRIESFTEAFHLLMLGAGVGYRVMQEDVDQLPLFLNRDMEVVFEPYEPYMQALRQEETTATPINKTHLFVDVGDSREGWVEALHVLLNAFTEQPNLTGATRKVTFNLNSVRPKGERISGFGGKASGAEPLQKLLEEVANIIKNEVPESGAMKPINASDVMNMVGFCVVSGNVRRSAEICLFDFEDKEMSNAKKGLWSDPALADKRYRAMSNNSAIFMGERPSKEDLADIFSSIRSEGEPGFINGAAHVNRRREAAIKWRPDEDPENYTHTVGTNPCAEICLSGGWAGLKAGSFCNLTTLPLPAFVRADGSLDYAELEECLRLIVRIGLRQTLVEISLPLWNKTQQMERLLGVDICGWIEAFDMLDWAYDSDEAIELRKWCKAVANDEATQYAEKLDVLRPLLVTTAKPNGTYAQLNTIASGIHWPYAPHYLRRIRMGSNDALAQTLKAQGVPTYPEVFVIDAYPQAEGNDVFEKLEWFKSQPEEVRDAILETADTWVLEFPVKTGAKVQCNDVSAIDQLENYKLFAKYYTDHNASVTVTVGEEEWDGVIDWVYNNWDDFVGISLLPKSADNVYPLLPYQTISEEEYNELAQSAVFEVDKDMLSQIEIKLDDPDDVDISTNASCAKATCPTR